MWQGWGIGGGWARGFFVALAAGVLALAPSASAQDTESARDPGATLARYETYLEGSPYAVAAFEGMLEAAAASGGVEALRLRFETLVDGTEDAAAGRIVLARLLARENEHERALVLIETVAAGDPRRELLRAAFLEELGREREALAALDLARERARDGDHSLDRDCSLELERRTAELHLWLGEREAAERAFAALATVDPGDERLRLEVADLCAGAELYGEALRQYETALAIAGGDAEARVRVLAAHGSLCERLGRTREALDLYRSVRTALGRGHWLEREVLERSLALARGAGALDALAEELEAEHERDPQDADTATTLARALELGGHADRARLLLAELARRMPSEPEIARRNAAFLQRAGDLDGAIGELERIARQQPDERTLVLELAELDLAAGRPEDALGRWRSAIARAPDDLELRRRIAIREAALGRIDEASALLEEVIARESNELGGYTDLVQLLGTAERPEEALRVIERAEPIAATNVDAILTLTSLARAIDAKERVLTLLARATELAPERSDAWFARGEIEKELSRSEDAVVSMWRAVRTARTPSQREQAIELLLSDRDDASIDELATTLEEATKLGAADLAELRVLVHALERTHEYERAAAAAERIAAVSTGDVEAFAALARLEERRGDVHGAIERYHELLLLEPKNAREWLDRIFRAHVQLGQRSAAVEVVARLAVLVAEDPIELVRLARALEGLHASEEALALARRGLRVGASKPQICTELAGIFERCHEPLDARRALLVAWRSARALPDGSKLAERALEHLYGLLQRADLFESEISTLEARVAADSWDVAAGRLLGCLCYLDFSNWRALEVFDGLIARSPDDIEILAWRERTLRDLDLHERRAADLRRLLSLTDDREGELAIALVSTLLSAGRLEEALAATGKAQDPLRVAKLFYDAGEYEAAADLLQPLAAREDASGTILELRARALVASGEVDCAREFYERRIELGAAGVPFQLEYADRLLELGLQEVALAFVDGMREEGRADPAISQWYDRHGLFDHLSDAVLLRCLSGAEQPDRFTFGSIARLNDDPTSYLLAFDTRIRELLACVGRGEFDGTGRAREGMTRDLLRCVCTMSVFGEIAMRTRFEQCIEGIRQDRLPDAVDTAMMLWRESPGSWYPPGDFDLAEIAGLYPGSAMVLAARATWEYERGSDVLAGELYLELAELLSAEPNVRAELADHARFLQEQETTCASIALLCSGRPDADTLQRTFIDPSEFEAAALPLLPFRAWALERSVLAFARGGQSERARDVLARIPAPDENAGMQWVHRVELMEEAALHDELAVAVAHLTELEDRTWGAGGLFDRRDIANKLAQHRTWLSERLARAGAWIDLYELSRGEGFEQARSLLQGQEAREAVETHLEQRIAAAERELDGCAPEDAAAREAAASELYDAGIKRLEIRTLRREVPEARALCERLLARIGEHPILLARSARIAELDGATEAAIALHERALAARRPDAVASLAPPAPDQLRPTAAPFPRMGQQKWNNIYAEADRADPLSAAADLVALVRLALEREDWAGAIERVSEVGERGFAGEKWAPLLAALVLEVPFGGDRNDLARAWYALRPDLPLVAMAYAAGLLEEERPLEARAALEELIARSPLPTGHRTRFDSLRARVDRAIDARDAAREPPR